MTDLPGYASEVYCWECLSTNHTANQCPYRESEDDDEEDEPQSLAAHYTNNDLRYALDKAAKQTEVAVLPLSSGLAKTHHLNALRLILEHLPKEDWVELRQPTQLAPGDVYMVTGPGWEVISQVPAEPILESTAAWHPRTGVRLRFGDILSNIASGVSLYQLSKDSTND